MSLSHHTSASNDVIVARSTASGPAALAVVRLDGRGASDVARRLFHPAGAAQPVAHPRRAVFGRWVDPATGEGIDEGITLFFAAPASYTGNDLVEFHCHGGPIPSARLIEASLALGARLAEPGEFTRRAFLNGKLDLAQAEAVADLINAQTDLAARMARTQLAGGLSAQVGAIRERLILLAAEIEARIDFPDEDIEPEDRDRLQSLFDEAASSIAALLETHRRGRILREGARVALVGAPNAGKSSLLNALARMERAIVTPHPGTTRDTIECTIDLRGIPLTLIDTAGLRSSSDPVERIGIERAVAEIERADLVILVHNVTEKNPPALAGAEAAPVSREPDLIVYNKIDLVPDFNLLACPWITDPDRAAAVSCTQGTGLPRLEEVIASRLFQSSSSDSDLGLAINVRHYDLLSAAQGSLALACEGFLSGLSGELVMVDLREALDAVDRIVGLSAGEEILDRLFGEFCIGK